MIKLLQNETGLDTDWKLEIDNELIEKVKIWLSGSNLCLIVWLDKTSKSFFSQKGGDFFLLQSEKIEKIEITISTKNIPENDGNKIKN